MKNLYLSPCSSKKIPIFEPFLKVPYYCMPHILGNMVYLNIKERDRF